jgi:hypothetical protein
MCGCGKRGAGITQNQRRSAAIAPPRIPTPTTNKVVFPVAPNNIKPMKMAPVSLPAPNESKDAESRRLKKLHQEAKLRSLGKI